MGDRQLNIYSNLNYTSIFDRDHFYYVSEVAMGGEFQWDSWGVRLEGRGGYSKIPLDRLSGVAPLDPQPPHIGQAEIFQKTWKEKDEVALFQQKMAYLGLSEFVLQYQLPKYFKIYAGQKFWEQESILTGWAGHPAARSGVDFTGESPYLGGGIEGKFPVPTDTLKEINAELSVNCRDTKHCFLFGHTSMKGQLSKLLWGVRSYLGYSRDQAWPTDDDPANAALGSFTQGGIVFSLEYPDIVSVSYAFSELSGTKQELSDRTQRRAHVVYASSNSLERFGIGVQFYLSKSEVESSVPERDPYFQASNIFLLPAISFSTGVFKKWDSHIPNFTLQFAYQFSKDLQLSENKGIGLKPIDPEDHPVSYPDHMGFFSITFNGALQCLFNEKRECTLRY